MLGEICSYSGKELFKHEFNTLAILMSTAIPSIGSFAGRMPRDRASSHMAVKSFNASWWVKRPLFLAKLIWKLLYAWEDFDIVLAAQILKIRFLYYQMQLLKSPFILQFQTEAHGAMGTKFGKEWEAGFRISSAGFPE